MKKLVIMFAILELVSCSSRKAYLLDDNGGFTVNQLQDQSAVLASSGGLQLLDFRRSYESEYGSYDSLADELTQQINASYSALTGKSFRIAPPKEDPTSIDDLSEQALRARRQQLTSNPEKYTILIRNVVIGEEIISSLNNSMPNPGMPGSGTTYTSTSSSCIVNAEVEIWDNRTSKRMLSFTASDKRGVNLFFYGAALRGAMENIANLIADVLAGREELSSY